MVLFPEGGFLRKRRETSQRYALKNNLPVLQHVSLPRVGALRAILDTIGYYKHEIGNNNSTVNNIHSKYRVIMKNEYVIGDSEMKIKNLIGHIEFIL